MTDLLKRCLILSLTIGAFLLYFRYGDFIFFEFAMLPQEVSERSNEIIAVVLLGISLLVIFAISLRIDSAWREKCASYLEIFLEKVMKCSPDDQTVSR